MGRDTGKALAKAQNEADLQACPDCGGVFAGGKAGCQAAYEALLAKEYSDLDYAQVHLLSVDAYCLQHARDHGVKNNAYHLASLCWQLEYSGSSCTGGTPRWLQTMFDGPYRFPTLEPPQHPGELSLADVSGASDGEEHARRVRRWAASVWRAWSEHQVFARMIASSRKGC